MSGGNNGRVEKVVIMGAAGRDFHNFNVYFRDNPRYKVIGFTATQIPDIDGRRYPAQLAGRDYPQGIPIHSEDGLIDLIKKNKVDLVAFSYSDIPHLEVMHKASRVVAAGADFVLIGASYTMLKSEKPVVAVCAVRTGCGKSQTTRKVNSILKEAGKKVVAVRHPMPYGDLTRQICQRFAEMADLDRHDCTIEEREEYEPHISQGHVVYAGVDYGVILKEAEKEADVIVWDGGNNDTPFYKPDIHIVVFDPHRPGHELLYHPGEANMYMADVAVINKVDSADPKKIEEVEKNIRRANPGAEIIRAESELIVDDPAAIKGKKVLVVEDGPTLTHGEMEYGAGIIAAKRNGVGQIIDPRPWVAGSIKGTYAKYPHIGSLLPAMGYGRAQVKDLEKTINAVECDVVLCATPIDLSKLITIDKPMVRVRYEYKDLEGRTLGDILKDRLKL